MMVSLKDKSTIAILSFILMVFVQGNPQGYQYYHQPHYQLVHENSQENQQQRSIWYPIVPDFNNNNNNNNNYGNGNDNYFGSFQNKAEPESNFHDENIKPFVYPSTVQSNSRIAGESLGRQEKAPLVGPKQEMPQNFNFVTSVSNGRGGQLLNDKRTLDKSMHPLVKSDLFAKEKVPEEKQFDERLASDDFLKNDLEIMNEIEDEILDSVKIPEEAKRVARQVRKERPGFFWTLARVAFETFNDTRSAIQQISRIVNDAIVPDSKTQKPISGSLIDNNNIDTTTPSSRNVNVTTMRTTTTTENFQLTQSEFQSLLRRNIKGLIRLFNIEWQDALNQSDITAREFEQDFRKQVQPYFQ